MNEHLKNSNEAEYSHIVPLFLKFKNICNASHNVLNVAKIVQFNRRMGTFGYLV